MENRKGHIQDLMTMLDNFENKLYELMNEGRDIVQDMQSYSGEVAREGQLLDNYLIRRIRSFLECNEIFRFDHARETLQEELEEIEAGVYDEETL